MFACCLQFSVYLNFVNFRVKAVNKEGDSEPLATEQATLAKNPYGRRLIIINHAENFENSIIFFVIDPPGKANKPNLVDWDKDHVDLEWSPPENDGGAPITK